MPLPLLFIGVAAASGMLGIGGAVKAGVDTNNAKRIKKMPTNSFRNRLIA